MTDMHGDAPRYAAVFDAGTTALKGALVRDDGAIVASASEDLDLIITGPDNEYREQDPDQWWRAFAAVSRGLLDEASANEPGFRTAGDGRGSGVGRTGDGPDGPVGTGRIAGVIFSGQMQDLIALDRDLNPVCNAILYSDGRAQAEATALAEAYGAHAGADAVGSAESEGADERDADPAVSAASRGERRFLDVVGNRLEGCLPLPKLMWMRAHEPEAFARTTHVLISSKDHLIARLTGRCVGDVAACSTAGAMDIRSGAWDAGLLRTADAIDAVVTGRTGDVADGVHENAGGSVTEVGGSLGGLLPELHRPQDVVGAVTAAAAALTGLAPGTPVYAGIGDAGATTFASGVCRPGQYNINLGTSGWIATVSPEPFVDKPGAANLAFGVAPGFVNAVPFLNAGDVHKWVSTVLAGNIGPMGPAAGTPDHSANPVGPDDPVAPAPATPDYVAAHDLIEQSAPGAHGVLCLPYLVGERFPVMNPSIRGAYVGISPDTTRADLVRAALEGVAFSIRQGMESFDAEPESISLIGGGAREPAWCRIMADVLGHPVTVFDDADILPAVALASLVLDDPKLLATAAHGATYAPDPRTVAAYDALYPRFTKLYPALSSLY